MPNGGKDDRAKAGDVGPIGKTDDDETMGEALAREGFEPARVGRRTVSQGKRREPLRKRASEKPDK